jgi:hypothetical protein
LAQYNIICDTYSFNFKIEIQKIKEIEKAATKKDHEILEHKSYLPFLMMKKNTGEKEKTL